MAARKKDADPVVAARFGRCACGMTRLSCRTWKRDTRQECCSACDHGPEPLL